MIYVIYLSLLLVSVESAIYTNTSEQCVQEGDTVTLIPYIKNLDYTSVVWHLNKGEINPYSIGGIVNPNLPEDLKLRITVVGNHTGNEYNLRILNVTKKDEGNYICKGEINRTLHIGYVFLSVKVLVYVETAVYTKTSEQCIHEGDTITLMPYVKKLDFTAVTWKGIKGRLYSRNHLTNPNLPDELRTRINMVGNHTGHEYYLRISNVSKSDEGNYSCIGEINKTLHIGYVFLLVKDTSAECVSVYPTSLTHVTEYPENVTSDNFNSSKGENHSTLIFTRELVLSLVSVITTTGWLITIAILILRKYRRRQIMITGNSDHHLNNRPVELDELNVHVYHSVRDIRMINDSADGENRNRDPSTMSNEASSLHSSFLNSDSSSNNLQPLHSENSSGYLHPYHSLIPNQTIDTHAYEDLPTNVQCDTGRSLPPVSPVDMEREVYINMYQSLEEGWENRLHSYEKLQKTFSKTTKCSFSDRKIDDEISLD